MTAEKVKIEYANEFKGTLKTSHGEVLVGNQENGMKPYNLLFGALGACFYSTVLGIIVKKRLTFDGAVVEINGSKREEVPTTLDHVTLTITFKNASNEEQFLKSAELGTKYCSVFETISKVAQIDLVVNFEN
jgi:putative redox protein